MKAFSSALSITAHVAVGVAVFFGTTKTAQTDPGPARVDSIVFVPLARSEPGSGMGIPGPINIGPPPVVGPISGPIPLPSTGPLMPTFSPTYIPVGNAGSGDPGGGLVTDERAEVLTAPLPIYPDLLRQAGVQGAVVLEAVVDTTGRILPSSIAVISMTNPGFVAAARQALLTTLFRPAMIGGRPIRMLVRIPYEFAIRNGTGRAP